MTSTSIHPHPSGPAKKLGKRRRVPDAFRRSAREEQIHAAVIELLRIKADPRTIYYHVPNSLPSTARSVHRFKTKLGMRPGVADIALVLPGGRSAFLEIKTPDGAQSLAQRGFELHCDLNGATYWIVRSVSEADVILNELGAYRVRPAIRRAA